MIIRDLKEIIKNLPDDMEVMLDTDVQTPPGTWIKTTIDEVHIRDTCFIISYHDELCDGNEQIFRIIYSPVFAADIINALEDNYIDYDFDSGERMMINQEGLDVLNAMGFDYDIVD